LVRVAAAVVLAGCLVSGLATGTRDAAAAVSKVQNKAPLEYGSAAGDADLAGTVVVSPAGAKTVTGGAFTFNVGATLNVGATQASGTYSGTFAVTVNYN